MKRNLILLLIVLVASSGCLSGLDSMTKKEQFKTVCLDGVTYYLFRESSGYSGYGYMSVKLDRDSKVVACDR